jgi:hypothetical protein
MHRTRLNRLGWLVAALFQLLLPTFASVADARVEAESARTVSRTHVEPFGTNTCPRQHPVDCVLCRFLATGAKATAAAAVAIPVARVIEAIPRECDALSAAARAPGDPPQRAPPV